MDSAAISELLIFLGIGAFSGWLAGILVKGRGFGLIGNIVVGVIGAIIGTFVGGLLASKSMNIALSSTPEINQIIWSTVGAIILLFIVGLFKK